MYQICVYDPGYILYIDRSTVIVFVYLYAYTELLYHIESYYIISYYVVFVQYILLYF